MKHNQLVTQVTLYYLNHVAEVLRSRQRSVEQWLGAENLRESDLYDSSCVVDVDVYCRLIVSAIRLSSMPHLGLVIGAQLSINHHGALGFALLNCGSIKEMLNFFQRYLITRTPLFSLDIDRHQDETQVVINSSLVNEQVQRAMTEVMVTTLFSTIQTALSRVGQTPIQARSLPIIKRVGFRYSQPDYLPKYQQLMGSNMAFSQAQTHIVLNNHWVDKQMQTVDQASLTQAKMFCEQELANSIAHASWQSKVLMQVIKQNDRVPDIQTIAEQLHLVPRTLHRYLKKEGTSFKIILEQAQLAMAKQYLAEHTSTIKSVAYRLGYSDVANFRRAFKRWCGITPQQYKQENDPTL
ncbi:AraC family transcriptional regulator ligand-binding domain-containing protein [Alteromonas sp. ASW11-36]|uniref:AraC family transcriptional regulator ligand-binding domain-containing protein n=1 Tax=Alteromonas arenosi TaxID=3055817 RepID=A0ABT7SY24_9ALTE|nr:AraC family transcriptional regulator [Alteromonas sp. ASW11-36]MDM7861082.1 AraC family transcriptional regulator ligand-binding domain-containing protein [Alteromonas sp. ASW11-36]